MALSRQCHMNICVTLVLAAIALARWSCPAHAFCEPTEEEIAAARVRIEAREASGMVGMGDDVAMVMDADNIRKRRAAAFRLRLSDELSTARFPNNLCVSVLFSRSCCFHFHAVIHR